MLGKIGGSRPLRCDTNLSRWTRIALWIGVTLVTRDAAVLAESRSGLTGKSTTVLPEAITAKLFAESGETQLRFFAAEIDLDDDGAAEFVVHLVGSDWCGTGGCTTFIYHFAGDSLQEVGRIPTSRPPIRVDSRSSHGWRNLLLGVGGGGVPAGTFEHTFDGVSYSGESSAPARRVSEDEIASAVTLIDRFGSWQEATLIESATTPNSDTRPKP